MADHHKLKNVTLRDVAKRVGVSAMTVSRAISGKSLLVNPETAKLCCKVAEEMGYVPNLMARSLRGEQLNTIVMFAEFISSHHYLAELVDLVSRSIEHRKYGVISCQSILSFHQALRNFKLAGAVVIAPPEPFYGDPFGKAPGGRHTHEEPTVVIHSAVEQNRFSEVSPDISGFCQVAAQHLVEMGHRHIGYLGGAKPEEERHWFDLRRKGIAQVFTSRNIPIGCLRHQPCPNADMAHAALQQLLTRAPQTTAVMCINDEIAIAAIVGARKLGLRVPRDLSVVGCNDINLANFFDPPLTTLAIDIRSMVETALDLLLEEVREGRPAAERKPIKIKLPAQLIVRESTAAPHK